MSSKMMACFFLSAALLNAACTAETVDVDDEAQIAQTKQALRTQNGIELNGTGLNGEFLNGVRGNGVRGNGSTINGVRGNGVRGNGTGLEGTTETGVTVAEMGFLGAEVDAELDSGSIVALHIDDISAADIPGMYTYVIKYGTQNICGTDAQGHDIKAIPLNGRWNYETALFVDDPNTFTIACRGAALAKCFEMGFSRFGTNAATGVANAAYHDACVRMIRADYCGTGVSMTHNGTLVDIWDKSNIQTRTSEPSLKLEAEWGPNGATCINHTRWETSAQGADVNNYIASTCPSRNIACDTGWGSGILRNASGQNDHSTAAFDAWTW